MTNDEALLCGFGSEFLAAMSVVAEHILPSKLDNLMLCYFFTRVHLKFDTFGSELDAFFQFWI